jgi:hypothetical protein
MDGPRFGYEAHSRISITKAPQRRPRAWLVSDHPEWRCAWRRIVRRHTGGIAGIHVVHGMTSPGFRLAEADGDSRAGRRPRCVAGEKGAD